MEQVASLACPATWSSCQAATPQLASFGGGSRLCLQQIVTTGPGAGRPATDAIWQLLEARYSALAPGDIPQCAAAALQPAQERAHLLVHCRAVPVYIGGYYTKSRRQGILPLSALMVTSMQCRVLCLCCASSRAGGNCKPVMLLQVAACSRYGAGRPSV